MLSPSDFAAFFQEIYGCTPFPWQENLLRRVADNGGWPDTLDLPTGSGKTAAIDIAVFHLALEASCPERRAPVRIAFVVDRRLVVDDAFARALNLARALTEPKGSVSIRVAARLRELSRNETPLVARRLRGGIPREDDWARTPAQPTVLCSTVDQIGSRLLFRGYGVSDSMKPVHAGLIGSDCLILLDEAHLAEPFRQTLARVQLYRGQGWRETNHVAPWGVSLLTATPGERSRNGSLLNDADRVHPVLQPRLSASKRTRLIVSRGDPSMTSSAAHDHRDSQEDVVSRKAVVDEVRRALHHFGHDSNGVTNPAIGVVVNRVSRARAIFGTLKEEFQEQIDRDAMAEPILMIGPARSIDRDELARSLDVIRTRVWGDGERRNLARPLIVVATQCLEAGVDIDFDALITDAAPIDALRQRFGRLNRSGRAIAVYGAVVAARSDLATRHDDPVYGGAIKCAWEYLTSNRDGQTDGAPTIDFGPSAFEALMDRVPLPRTALSSSPDAPILLPAHVDLLCQTSPVPAADPEVALYLHGPNRQADSVSVVWRADVDPEIQSDEVTRRLLLLAPPRAGESIQLPWWAVRRWLLTPGAATTSLADVPVVWTEEEPLARSDESRAVFCWKGDDERSRWTSPSKLRPGDTVVVPAGYGGLDLFGWNPRSTVPVTDVGARAAEAFAGRRFVIRAGPRMLGEYVPAEVLAEALSRAPSRRWQDLRLALTALEISDAVRRDLGALDHARRHQVVPYVDLYGHDGDGRPRGVVFVAPFGITQKEETDDGLSATEDDASGSIPGFSLDLETHCRDVERTAAAFARASGLPASRVADLQLAGRLHDVGKSDARFQAWLHYGDSLGPDPAHVLAKSGRSLPRLAREASGLPDRWRHEARSVRLTVTNRQLTDASDPELVLWLIGTHHGHGRPLFPHRDTDDGVDAAGPESLAFDWRGLDWAALFERLKARYGVWELARMEAILRLADHRASEHRAIAEARA